MIKKLTLVLIASGLGLLALALIGIVSMLSGSQQVIPADEDLAKEYQAAALENPTIDWEMAMVIDLYTADFYGYKDLLQINRIQTMLNLCEIEEKIYAKEDTVDEEGNITSSDWYLDETNLYIGADQICEYLGIDAQEQRMEAVKQKVREKGERSDSDTKYEVEMRARSDSLDVVVNTYYPELASHLEEMMALYDSHYFLLLYTDIAPEDIENGYSVGSGAGYNGNIEFDSSLSGRVCEWAVSKVGCGYDQNNRFGANTFDCSSLVYRAYQAHGINISYAGSTTAAEEARGLVDRGCQIGYEQLRQGDLIFYQFGGNNGRYKNISHVVMYIGNGQIVHARSRSTGVRVDPLSLFQRSKIRVIARPSGLQEE